MNIGKYEDDEQLALSFVDTYIIQSILQWARCKCGKVFDYTLTEKTAEEMHLFITCKAGHLFNRTFMLEAEYVVSVVRCLCCLRYLCCLRCLCCAYVCAALFVLCALFVVRCWLYVLIFTFQSVRSRREDNTQRSASFSSGA